MSVRLPKALLTIFKSPASLYPSDYFRTKAGQEVNCFYFGMDQTLRHAVLDIDYASYSQPREGPVQALAFVALCMSRRLPSRHTVETV